MSANINQEQFSIPEQTLRTLSFCEPTASHLAQWTGQLPMANLGEASRQLYHAIIELNQLIVNPEIRFKLIEIIRPAIEQVSLSLTKYYLNQPILLPPKARKVSKLAMALDNHLMIAYKTVIHDRKRLSQSLLTNKPKKIVAQSIYQAMWVTTHIIVRASHLYMPAPEKAWHELHQLYLIAESNQLLGSVIEHKHNRLVHKTSIVNIYIRAMMMGSCNINQIRQSDISNIFEATELWARHVKIVPAIQAANFIINLKKDSAPIYRELTSGKNSPFYRGIDMQPLLGLFKEYLALLENTEEALIRGLTIPVTINKQCVAFLIRSWESLTARTTNRLPSDKSVQMCIGFRSTHYYLSGSVDFETQLQRDAPQINSATQFTGKDINSLSDSKDPWGTAFDTEHDDRQAIDHSDVSMQNANNLEAPSDTTAVNALSAQYPQYTTCLIDISPNGYCIKWDNNVPAEVKAGEIVGINEQQRHLWAVGVIRWISQPKSGITTMGVELLATTPIPCGARAINSSQPKTDFMRALLLPAQDAVGQPATFIAPNMPFKENLTVVLNQYGATSQGLLGACTLSTGSFSQFIFEPQLLRSNLSNNDDDDENI